MSEKNLKTNVCKMIKKDFPKAWFWKISDKFYAGIPDLLVLIDGKAIFMELKYGKNTLQKIQIFTINQINKAGIKAVEVRSVAQAKMEILNLIERG